MEPTISALVQSVEAGEPAAADALFAALYAELRRLAARQLASRGAGASLGTTSLLHEAYLDMSGREGNRFPDRARFLGYAARVMRGLIVDAARRNQAEKRGGQFIITGLDGREVAASAESVELSRLSDALDELTDAEPELAELVELKYFCGFSFAEIAEIRGITERTAQRHWERARLFLHRTLREGIDE